MTAVHTYDIYAVDIAIARLRALGFDDDADAVASLVGHASELWDMMHPTLPGDPPTRR